MKNCSAYFYARSYFSDFALNDSTEIAITHEKYFTKDFAGWELSNFIGIQFACFFVQLWNLGLIRCFNTSGLEGLVANLSSVFSDDVCVNVVTSIKANETSFDLAGTNNTAFVVRNDGFAEVGEKG